MIVVNLLRRGSLGMLTQRSDQSSSQSLQISSNWCNSSTDSLWTTGPWFWPVGSEGKDVKFVIRSPESYRKRVRPLWSNQNLHQNLPTWCLQQWPDESSSKHPFCCLVFLNLMIVDLSPVIPELMLSRPDDGLAWIQIWARLKGSGRWVWQPASLLDPSKPAYHQIITTRHNL